MFGFNKVAVRVFAHPEAASAHVFNSSFTHLPVPLPETSNLLSVFMFAECILSGTRQISSLPSATLKTLGKKKHSVKRRFAECQKKHLTKMGFAECFFDTRQRSKIFFLGK